MYSENFSIVSERVSLSRSIFYQLSLCSRLPFDDLDGPEQSFQLKARPLVTAAVRDQSDIPCQGGEEEERDDPCRQTRCLSRCSSSSSPSWSLCVHSHQIESETAFIVINKINIIIEACVYKCLQCAGISVLECVCVSYCCLPFGV